MIHLSASQGIHYHTWQFFLVLWLEIFTVAGGGGFIGNNLNKSVSNIRSASSCVSSSLLSHQCTRHPNRQSPSLDRVPKGRFSSHQEWYVTDTPRIPASTIPTLLFLITWYKDLDMRDHRPRSTNSTWKSKYGTFTISNNRRTSFSDSPLYLDVSVEEETLKKVVPHSVATALASIVFPVPGGPTISTPWKSKDEVSNTLDLNVFHNLASTVSTAVHKDTPKI